MCHVSPVRHCSHQRICTFPQGVQRPQGARWPYSATTWTCTWRIVSRPYQESANCTPSSCRKDPSVTSQASPRCSYHSCAHKVQLVYQAPNVCACDRSSKGSHEGRCTALEGATEQTDDEEAEEVKVAERLFVGEHHVCRFSLVRERLSLLVHGDVFHREATVDVHEQRLY